ncbi:cupin domain-containing protein [Mesorhizobium amorphae]|uniref:cupin domain-containing protein n=1 Tax=Mesorhizobium amorphae TaxID=71433 RepID=UPI0011837E27|nr:cupin domain-containing protein [Mesorhizobium amorphae]
MAALQPDDFRGRLGQEGVSPLWDVLDALVTPRPAPRTTPAAWRYDVLRPLLVEAGDLITAREAERRVLILQNPAIPGQHRTTDTLYTGLQLVLPGELAPAHRHTQSALRLVLESEGAWTAVDGERVEMSNFDLVLTPNWRWHEHGNDGTTPAIWLDGLDIPIVSAFAGGFAEHLGNNPPPSVVQAGDSRARYGSALKPVVGTTADRAASGYPLFHYPYVQWRQALEDTAAASDADPHFGCVMEFANPLDGASVMGTISAFVQLLRAGTATRPCRQSASAVYVGIEGQAVLRVDGKRFEIGPRDVVAVPSWGEFAIEAGASDAVLFNYSDRVCMEKLGLWREQRG